MIDDVTDKIKTIAEYGIPNGIKIRKFFKAAAHQKWVGNPKKDEMIAKKFEKIKKNSALSPTVVISIIVIIIILLSFLW